MVPVGAVCGVDLLHVRQQAAAQELVCVCSLCVFLAVCIYVVCVLL